MRLKTLIISILTLASLAGSSFLLKSETTTLQENRQLAGGAATVLDRSFSAFEIPAEGLSEVELAKHVETDPLFDRSHIPLKDHLNAGLGPLHNAKSCSACHALNGRGRPVEGESLFRVSLREEEGTMPVPGIGFQLQDRATFGHEPEALVVRSWVEEEGLRKLKSQITRPDGTELAEEDVARSLRIPPPVIGMGLLEAIPEADILSNADPDDLDGDGISGRPVWNTNENGDRHIGRFGWKAMPSSVLQQSVNAYLDDMGITTPINQETTLADNGLPADISWDELEGVTYYTQTLGVPATAELSSSRIVRQGVKLFNQLECASCHVAKQKTGNNPDAVAAVINNQTIWPYTDLLLHDMGPGLDDGVAEHGLSESAEWRTPPLWGIGLTKRINHYVGFLHDGRARTLEEAILWHGGEAESSKKRYESLKDNQKVQLLTWLEQL